MELFELIVVAPSVELRTAWVSILGRALARLVGGFSIYKGQGGWIDPSGTLLTEEHTRLIAYTPDKMSAIEAYNCLVGTIRQYQDNCHQEIVLVILNGEPWFLNEIIEIPLK